LHDEIFPAISISGRIQMHLFYHSMIKARFTHCFSWTVALSICIVPLLASCGSGNGSTKTPQEAVDITVQPLSQTVPIGETASFTVTATGTAPFSYQWSENGVEIPGAISASYTTSAVSLGSSTSTLIGSFNVTVSNSTSSATSSSATLNAGPRSPKAGDLRYLLFQQVNLPGLLDDGGLSSGVEAGGGDDSTSASVTNAIGTPLQLGSSSYCGLGGGSQCVWLFDAENLPSPMTGLSMYYKGGEYLNFESDLQSIAADNVLFTSFDLVPASNAYAVSWVQTSQAGGFDYKLEVVPPSQVSATSVADGTASRVITSASFDASGNANLISYGWTGDTTTVFETQAAVVQHGEVCSTAATLAGEGYIISAFGGNNTDGFILIGMRVLGDSLPRSIDDPIGGRDESPYFTNVVSLTDTEGDCYVNEQ
jgi:hypothetical protein